MDIKQSDNLIYTALDFQHIKRIGYRRLIEKSIRANQPRIKFTWETKGDPVFAEIIHGRWLVQCLDCNSAQDISNHDPFLCGTCANVTNGYYARVVIFPTQRQEIELILSKRPLAKNRNWLLGETLDLLHRDNAAHGIKE